MRKIRAQKMCALSFRYNFLTKRTRLKRNLKEDKEAEKTGHFGFTSRKLCFNKKLL